MEKNIKKTWNIERYTGLSFYLAGEAGDVLVEGILDKEADPDIIPGK